MSLNLYSGHAVLGMVISEQKSAPLRLHMQYTVCKGQLISKGLFDTLNSPKKWTKNSDFTTMIPQGRLVFVVFLEEIEGTKKTF